MSMVDGQVLEPIKTMTEISTTIIQTVLKAN
jgi:hypothetical protein